jgi:hypothetical protein
MVTPKGKYAIFDITLFLPGRTIPSDFCKEAEERGPYFFQPSHWTQENYWGGSNIAYLATRKGFLPWPMMYSTGFPTAEAALEAATEWENGEADRASHAGLQMRLFPA